MSSLETYGALGSDDEEGGRGLSLEMWARGWKGDEDFERLYRRPELGELKCYCASEVRDRRGWRGSDDDDGNCGEDEGYGSSARRDYDIRDRNGGDGAVSRFPQNDNYDDSAGSRSLEFDPRTHQPAYLMNSYDFPSIKCSDRDTEAYFPIQRPWAEDCQKAMTDAGYGGDGVLGTPMSRWDMESRRERPWDHVGGVYPGDHKWSAYGYGYGDPGAGEYNGSAESPEYWGSDIADAGTGGYGSRRPESWGSNVADVGNDRAYTARTSSRSSRTRR
ncbi:hypothetical protein N7G274_004193 [Stereocaulon virgatum]|uniref:Uncharacterized protein n=1 Tax=Stereocaulon virgatum TaxID=373712 RepID=A0ABR4AI90_9LECA